ncbi:MAG: hypothetical protein AAFX79_01900 [Planctomycetota bacterium]
MDPAAAAIPNARGGVLRVVLGVIAALAIAGVATAIFYTKLTPTAPGPARVVLVNATGASLIDPGMTLRVPDGGTVAVAPPLLDDGDTWRVYDGPGPIEIEMVQFVDAASGAPVQLDSPLDGPATGVLTLTVGAGGALSVERGPLPPE